jgi:hypothetical protein
MRFILTILFSVFVFCSDAQIIRANAYYTPLSQPLLLDVYTGAAAAYSLRKLRTAYTGAAIRVRRSSDNTEQDIGFVGVDLDTVSLKNFVGANSGFVTTWYDQSTNARNATQTTAANQPRVVNAGAIERIAGKPSLFFDGSNDNLRADNVSDDFTGEDKPVTAFVIVNKTNTNTIGIISGFGRSTNTNPILGVHRMNASPSFEFQIRDNSGTLILRPASNISYAANTNYLFTINSTGTAVNIYINSINRTPVINSVNVTSLTLDRYTIGAITLPTTSTYFGGYISENILYASDNSSNRTGIETNINSFYAIY